MNGFIHQGAHRSDRLIQVGGTLLVRNKNCRELVATEASDYNSAVREAAQSICHLYENLVPTVVTQSVVDLLEVIEIDDCDRESPSIRLRLGRGVAKDMIEVAAGWGAM